MEKNGSSKGSSRDITTLGSRVAVLVEDDEQLDEIEVVPNNFEPTPTKGSNLGTTKVSKVGDKDVLKRNLQKAAMISNRGEVNKSDKGDNLQGKNVQIASSKAMQKDKWVEKKTNERVLRDVSNKLQC
ncbi:hypothetical protein REPUB_Repub14bG0043300 [Reevesia pubescens]